MYIARVPSEWERERERERWRNVKCPSIVCAHFVPGPESLTGSVKAAPDRIESLAFSYRLFLLLCVGYVRCFLPPLGFLFLLFSSTRVHAYRIPSTNFFFVDSPTARWSNLTCCSSTFIDASTIHPSLLFFPLRPNSLYISTSFFLGRTAEFHHQRTMNPLMEFSTLDWTK